MEDKTSIAGSFWLPFGLLLILTPIFLLLAFLSAGAGHGSYFQAKILFSFTMLSTELTETITAPFLLFSLFQFPFYGLVFGMANLKLRLRKAIVAVSVLHVLAVIGCFVFIGSNFC